MIRIAVVDDNVPLCYSIETMLKDISDILSIEFIVEHYYDGERLCSDLKNGVCYDIILLDIELKDMNGIQAADFIRTELDDELQQIVFISAKKQYSLELHSYHPFDFLIKPIKQSKLENLMKRFLKVRGEWNEVFTYKVGKSYETVKVKNIKYLTVFNRVVVMILDTKTDNRVEFYGTLQKIYSEQLKKFGFLFLHKQYIVNPIHIRIFEYDKVIMNDGVQIPIGSSKRKEIRDRQINQSFTEDNK